MATLKRRVNFLESEEGLEVACSLRRMMTDEAYNTTSTYSPNSVLYPDHLVSFVDKHLSYLIAHPAITSQEYLSNLRLMTRLR